jgi:hypothetical protein
VPDEVSFVQVIPVSPENCEAMSNYKTNRRMRNPTDNRYSKQVAESYKQHCLNLWLGSNTLVVKALVPKN